MQPSQVSMYHIGRQQAAEKALFARMMADLFKMHDTFLVKVDAIEKLISKNRELMLHPDRTELLNLIKPLIRHGRDGETPSDDKLLAIVEPLIERALRNKVPSKEETFASIKDMLPVFEEPKIILTETHLDTIAEKVSERLAKGKSNEQDPTHVLEKIMSLPEGKRISTKHVDGLDQTIHAMQSQLKRQYLHGGGISSLIAGSGITLVKNSDGSYTITASASSGANTAIETLTPTQVGSNVTLNLTGLSHTFVNILGVTRQGVFQNPSTTDGWSRSGNTVTVTNASDSDTYQVMYTY